MRYILSFILLILLSLPITAQNTLNSQSLFSDSNNNTTQNDTTAAAAAPLFSIKDYFRALGHKDSMSVSHMFLGSIVLPGTAQIYNEDYWKLPIVYGGLGTLIYTGYKNNIKYIRTGDETYKNYRNYLYMGAGALYWSVLMDGIVSYKSDKRPDAGKATLYSALLPGLGQAYLGDYWRIPIYYGGLLVCAYAWNFNNTQYVRFRDLYRSASQTDSDYTGSISVSNLKYYRDQYRRYRDYSVLATAIVYVLNIIDANVFSYMSDFDISDDLAFKVSPTIIDPVGTNFASVRSFNNNSSVGFSMTLTF